MLSITQLVHSLNEYRQRESLDPRRLSETGRVTAEMRTQLFSDIVSVP